MILLCRPRWFQHRLNKKKKTQQHRCWVHYGCRDCCRLGKPFKWEHHLAVTGRLAYCTVALLHGTVSLKRLVEQWCYDIACRSVCLNESLGAERSRVLYWSFEQNINYFEKIPRPWMLPLWLELLFLSRCADACLQHYATQRSQEKLILNDCFCNWITALIHTAIVCQ